VICGLEIEVLWSDEHVVEYRLRAGNGRFAGEADFYDNYECFSRIAGGMRGFPQSADDARDIELGTFNPDDAGGGVHLRLRSVDGAGHAAVRVTLRSGDDDPSTAEFCLPVEAAGIDRFVRALAGQTTKAGSRARLGEAT